MPDADRLPELRLFNTMTMQKEPLEPAVPGHVAHELARRGGQFGLMTVCAAGGMGHAMVVERA